jgi:hypothetical protein
MGTKIVRLATESGQATMTHSGKDYAKATIEVPDTDMAQLQRDASFHGVTVTVVGEK